MTGNITIHSAVWATICGSIEFTTNFTRRRYRLTVAIGEGLTICDLTDKNAAGYAHRSVTRDEVLAIIRQDDNAMWTWATFLCMWQGWAAGYEAGRNCG